MVNVPQIKAALLTVKIFTVHRFPWDYLLDSLEFLKGLFQQLLFITSSHHFSPKEKNMIFDPPKALSLL